MMSRIARWVVVLLLLIWWLSHIAFGQKVVNPALVSAQVVTVDVKDPVTRQPVTKGPLIIDVPAHYLGTLYLEDLTLVPSGPGQTAIFVRFPEWPSVIEITVVLRNVTVRAGFANCVHFINAWNAIIEALNCQGAYDGDLQNGIIVQGQTHDLQVVRTLVAHAITGIYITDVAEGTVIMQTRLLGVVYGVFAISAHAGRPWLVFGGGGHIACSRACIVAINRKQVQVLDSLLYRHLRAYETDWPWEAMHFANVTEATVRDVIVDCKPNAAATYPGTGKALQATPEPERVQMQVKGC